MILFVKFVKVFHHQTFALYGTRITVQVFEAINVLCMK